MPKTLWLPGGRGGGGRFGQFWTDEELTEKVTDNYQAGYNVGLAQGAAQERLHRKNDEAAAAKLSEVLLTSTPCYSGPLLKTGGNLNRPYPNPKALRNPPEDALAEPVERVRWWETIDSTTSFFVTVVALILIVLVAIVVQGVTW